MQKHRDISASSFGDWVLYFKPFAGGYIYLRPNLWQFLLWLSVASATNQITGDLVNLCFNVREPAAPGSEHFNCPLIERDKDYHIYGKYLQPC